MPSYRSNDVHLHYDELGAGDPIVVLGGGPARHPDYLGDLGGLDHRHTLVVPHLRGTGESPFPDDPTLASWWSQAADMEALRQHLGIERLTVLGHSAGTRIALAWSRPSASSRVPRTASRDSSHRSRSPAGSATVAEPR